MKKFVISTAFVLAIPAVSFTNASFGSAAYAKNVDSSRTENCQFVPPARPSGGATRETIAAIEECNEARSSEQQTPSTSSMEQPSSPSDVPSSIQQNQEPSSSVQPSTPGSMTMPPTTTDQPNGVTTP